MSEEAVSSQQQEEEGAAQEADPGSQEKEEPDVEGKGGAEERESAAVTEVEEHSGTKEEEQGESPPSPPPDEEKAEEAQAEDKAQEDAVGEETEHKEEPPPQTVVEPADDPSVKDGDDQQKNGGDEQQQEEQQRDGGISGEERQPKSAAEEDEGTNKLELQSSHQEEKTGGESNSEMEGHPPKTADKLELQSSPQEEKTGGESTSEMEGHPPKTADKKKKKGKSGDGKSMPKLKRKSSRLESAGGKSVTGSIATTDLFDDTVRDMFSIADAQQKGYLTREEFENFLQLDHFSGCLDQTDYTQSLQYFDSSASDEQLAYDMFAPVARELILRVYQVRDTSGSEWVQLSTSQGVNFWLNKFTGETRVVDETPLAERQQEIDFMNQVYSQLDTTQTELDQEKTRSKELANQIYHLQEEMEKAHEALYTTGQTLDDTSAELQAKNSEIDKLAEMLEAKEVDNQKMQERIAELEQLSEEMQSTKTELNNAKSLVSRQEGRLIEKEAVLSQLQYKCDSTVEQLKSATGVIDARESSVRTLTKALDGEKGRVKEFEHQVPQMEMRLKSMEEELAATKQQLDEKIRALQTTRKQLKSTRDRNMELEKDVEKLLVVKEKHIEAEGEIRTLKSFLASKTSLVEKKRSEVKELQGHMMEMEKKDEKRAIILASVLEKTARMQQSSAAPSVSPRGVTLHRSTSAPSLLPDVGEDVTRQLRAAQSKRKAHTTGKVSKPWTTGPPQPPHTSRAGRTKKKTKRAHTLPRLPPLTSTQSDKKDFSFPTLAEIKHRHRLQDAVVVEHSPSNPACRCAMCLLHESASMSVAKAGLPTAAAVTGLAGLGSLAKHHGDEREVQLSKKLHLGDRVIVQMKRTMYDLEPQKVTGIVKYVGKVDSEYVDNRMYVGVKLDDPMGDSDGLFKGKRYFTCTPKHGKMVRISNVIAVLYPKLGTAYQPLVSPQQKPPYNPGSLSGDTMMQLSVK